VLRGELQSLDSKFMRGAEPVVRPKGFRWTVYQLLILKTIMAKAFEPCQGGNTAALRSVFRV